MLFITIQSENKLMEVAFKCSPITVNIIIKIATVGEQPRFPANVFGGSDQALPLDGNPKHTESSPLMLISVCISIPGAEPIK